MHDDQQLRSILRRMDRPTDPDPEFADALFRQLTATSRTRPSRTAFVLLAAALLVATLAAGAVVGSGVVDLPWFTSDANPIPSHSPAAAPSEVVAETATPAPSDTAVPSATPSPTPPLQEISVGMTVTPVIDGVTLRESPGTGGTRIGTLAQGSQTYVLDGPVDADGYTWYQLSGPGLPTASGCVSPVPTAPLECPTWLGWAAVGDPDDESAWFAPTTVECPDPAEETDAFVTLPQIFALPCYGDAELTFKAFYSELPEGGLGGTNCTDDTAIMWLYCLDIGYYQVTSAPGAVPMTLYVDPASGVTLPERGTWLLIRGAFDHPDSTLCASAAEHDNKQSPLPDPEYAVVVCRTHFVPTAVEETVAP
jgi:hypothetical protein